MHLKDCCMHDVHLNFTKVKSYFNDSNNEVTDTDLF